MRGPTVGNLPRFGASRFQRWRVRWSGCGPPGASVLLPALGLLCVSEHSGRPSLDPREVIASGTWTGSSGTAGSCYVRYRTDFKMGQTIFGLRQVLQRLSAAFPREAGGGIKEGSMLYTIAVILVVLWILGLVSSYTMGGFIHVLLLIAVVVIVIQVLQGRRG